MRQIDIITRHAIVNYGSLFQAYATQELFRDLGYDARIIDYIARGETPLRRVGAFSRGLSMPKRLLYRLVKAPDEVIKDAKFSRYRRKLLRLTERFSSPEELRAHDFGDAYLCAGSDQLWGYMPDGGLDPAYFLDFGTDKNKYFSYAASLGRTDFDAAYFETLKRELGKFDFLTVREQSAAQLIAAHTPYTAAHILDPTLMVPRSFWLSRATGVGKKYRYILLYQLRRSAWMDAYVRALSDRCHLPVVRVTTSLYDVFRFGKKQILKSPNRVLTLFRDAAYVVTDSFHATVFSLIFNRKFVDVLPPETHERITDLLSSLGLKSRVATALDPIDPAAAEQEIDWSAVNGTLARMREQGLTLLREGLDRLGAEE